MEFFEKIDAIPAEDLSWNIPEQKQGKVNVIGGSVQNFRTEIKTAEFLTEKYPLEEVRMVLPEKLKNKLPPLPNFCFVPATESGSIADSQLLRDAFNTADFNLVLGDLSRNNVTGQAISSACEATEKMTVLTRDSVDLVADYKPEKFLMNENLIIFASLVQLQKLLKAIYYPKMLLMSQPLMQVAEVLHKFTLSYPIAIMTLNNDQILVAENGTVKALALEKSGYSTITIWSGELVAKVVAMNLYNPNNFLGATINAIIK
ncbi:hypothetical protein IKF28_01180 [Candidatus Saccharibacteria bacterium]|nr:hypothetical protein [Candidatus Saccharibacteria bacterium]